jgi:DNA replication initiation complex subunit (GINS family)
MSAKPLAEAYEKLKELRRQADSSGDIASFIQDLEAEHDEVAAPRDAEAAATVAPLSEALTRTIRMIATKTLAERIFGDSGKADAWLTRPSAELSGQRPVDLLRDELGTDVVREMLERIDHGIFA